VKNGVVMNGVVIAFVLNTFGVFGWWASPGLDGSGCKCCTPGVESETMSETMLFGINAGKC